ncbi:uncharacterized protein LOC100366880 [Saccoglossus kowalevskii]|uniref:Uncharacterized protein LOC100366880 n=1 Tax=Saccoglossus kowalevskii TaxID=10224 RepID=A0ABM0GZU0_SACKO|nr:PREDICTED: uncharacterized protein LOC100366880 [Saccoglossus kowalevskii]
MTGPSTFQGIKGSQIKVPDLVPSPKSNCYAFHCDYYKENYAWLILDPPNDKDIQIDVLYRNQRKDSEKNDKLKRAFAFKLSAGNVAGPAKDDHKIELKTLADVPFNLGNLHLSKNHVALLIKDLVGNRKRTTRVIRYGFSMTEVSTKDHRLIESGKTFTVSSVNTVDMKIKVKENELMLCVDWCPLESCKYQIMRQSNDIPGRIAYQLVAKVPCQIEGVGFGGHLTNNKLIGYARGYDCTPAKFRSLQCLVYDVTGENCDSTDRAVGYSSKYIALEPFDNLNFHNGDPNFRFCHGNIIDYLFNGGHWEQTGSSVDSSSSDEDVKRSVPEYRIKRSVSPDTDSPPECAGYFVGNSWPPRVTDMSLGKNVKICQTCRQSESGKDRYCFATLYNTDLRLPEYSAYTVHSLQSRLNSNPPAPISRKKVDSALWKRFEIGLCRESTKKKVPKKEWNSLPLVYEGNVGHTCKDLGAIGVDEHNNNIVYTYESGKIGHPCDPLYLDKQKCEDMQSSDSDYNVANNAVKGLWSRGHLNPSGIHNMVDIYMMQSTFTLTNAAPQLTSFNNGEWNTMECLVEHYVWYLRTHPGTQIVDDSQEVFIVTGTRPHATPIKIANNRLTSPEYYWTALCDPYFKRSLFFSGNNEPGFTGTTRIHVYDSLTSFQEWLWGSGTPNEIFPGKAEQCSNVIDLDMIPLTERCENELVFKNTPLDTISRRGLITLIKSINL